MDADLTLDGLDFESLRTEPITLPATATTFRSDAVAIVAAEVDSPMVFSAEQIPPWAAQLGVFDLETTGIDPATSRIVSAHVGVLGPDGLSIERQDWLADPGVEIPEGAAAVHGITTERARAEGRPAPEVVSEILEALRDLSARRIPVVIYNAPYDLTLLMHEAVRHGHRALDDSLLVIDPLVVDKAVDKYRRGKRTLTAAADCYGVSLLDAHDSCADAIAAGRVAQALARRYAAELWLSADELHALQVAWCREQTESFIAYMRRVKDPQFTTSDLWPVRELQLDY